MNSRRPIGLPRSLQPAITSSVFVAPPPPNPYMARLPAPSWLFPSPSPHSAPSCSLLVFSTLSPYSPPSSFSLGAYPFHKQTLPLLSLLVLSPPITTLSHHPRSCFHLPSTHFPTPPTHGELRHSIPPPWLLVLAHTTPSPSPLLLVIPPAITTARPLSSSW